MTSEIAKLKEWVDGCDNIVFFGGAGVSTESGIPDFRSVDGLSYTTFAYSDLEVSPLQQHTQGEYTIKVNVTNTGKRAGDEVVQLYVRDKVSSVITYDSQLRGFERVSLQPGETRQVTFSLNPEDLQILDRNMNWTVEPGEFEVMIGASSQDIRLKKTITALP